ncbi:FecR family protein [Puteibacter caeruleilacunae]|nr:FecR family protein [Puteibacter caeruleilacunae]
MEKEKLHQFAQNKLSKEADIKAVLDWVEASDANRDEYIALKNVSAMTGFRNYEKLEQTRKETNGGKLRSLQLLKYAAVFIIACCIGGLTVYLANLQENSIAYNKVVVPYGESAEVILSDDTHVFLSSGSTLSYPTSFERNNRDVKLLGEAFFEVSHNPERPFHVKTNHLTVEVLGTSFNVEAFEDADNINVCLVEGKVNLQSASGKVLTSLQPGENATYDLIKKNMDIQKVNTDYYTSWRNGYLMFKDESLENIAQKFERYFNIEIKFKDETIKSKYFTGTIMRNKPIDQVFDILKYTSGINYQIEERENKPSIVHLSDMPM